jgi:hypothetical protein
VSFSDSITEGSEKPSSFAWFRAGRAAVHVWRLIDSLGLEIPPVAQFERVAAHA